MSFCIDEKDLSGNRLYTDESCVYLKLGSENRRRMLGKCYTSGKGNFVVEKEIEERHVLQKAQAIGFCDELLRRVPEKTVMAVRLCGDTLFLTIEEIRAKGSYLWFKNQGFERQFFVKIEDFKVKGWMA